MLCGCSNITKQAHDKPTNYLCQHAQLSTGDGATYNLGRMYTTNLGLVKLETGIFMCCFAFDAAFKFR